MVISLAELIVEIGNLEKEIAMQSYELRQNAKSTYIREIGGSETQTTEPFEFNSVFNKWESNHEKLIVYKTALAEMNATNLIDGKSIFYILNTLKHDREILKTIELCLGKKASIQRKTDGSGPSASYYIVEKTNYDKDSLEETKAVLEQEIKVLETQLQKANLTATVDI